MWTIEPEQIWKKPRRPGISGFMRLKNEATFLDQAIQTHLPGLDELIIVHNDCVDETPEICRRWARLYPDKIKVTEYEPSVIPIGTPESLTIDPRSPHCIANYYNFALALTSRAIAIKVDGDHLAIASRFSRICDVVRRNLKHNERYPIYGLNITEVDGEIAIYNYYNYAPQFTGDRAAKKGPPPFTSGDHAFYYVDKTSWHTVDPLEGFEVMNFSEKARHKRAPMTYAFLHLKGMKADRGTGNWNSVEAGASHKRGTWTKNVLAPDPAHLASIEAMRHHNPAYFRGADVAKELHEAFPDLQVRRLTDERLPPTRLREQLADLWYRIAYP